MHYLSRFTYLIILLKQNNNKKSKKNLKIETINIPENKITQNSFLDTIKKSQINK